MDVILKKKVPSFGQFETPSLIGQIVNNKITTSEDPNWKASGAKTKAEYDLWSWNACGMACLKMILAKETGKIYPIVKLGKTCMRYGAYKRNNQIKTGLDALEGMYYEPFVKCIDKEYGLKGETRGKNFMLNEVIRELKNGNYVIASVNRMIREPKSTPDSKGGHLVLLLGYDLGREELYFHNPTGISKETQEYARIGFNDFKKFFAEKGIVIKST